MATVIRAPFWVPRPSDDFIWNARPVRCATIALLTAVQMFGAGGQAPTKAAHLDHDVGESQWQATSRINRALLSSLAPPAPAIPPRWAFGIDDAPMWQGAPIDAAPVQQLTAQKFFGAGGQVAQPRQWNFGIDDAAVWSGSPVDAAPIQLLTAQKFFGAGGQVAQPRQWNFGIDDAAVWSGSPIDAAPIQLLTPQKVYGAGGQVPPSMWDGWRDDAPQWQGAPLARSMSLYPALTTNPFNNRQVRSSFTLDDAPQWQGPESSGVPIALLPSYFYAPASSETMRWAATAADDAPRSQPVPLRNASLYGQVAAPQNPFTVQQPWQYAESAFWVGTPLDAAPVQILTVQKFFGAGGQVAQPRQWNFGIDDATVWSGSPVDAAPIALLTAQKVYGAGGQVPPSMWDGWRDDAPQWQGAPVARTMVLYPPILTNPFSNRLTVWYSEDAFWQGTPIDAAPIALLTAQKVYGAGGQVPPSMWDGWRDDAPQWQGAPVARIAGLYPAISTSPFDNRLTVWYGEDAFWQGAPAHSVTLAMLSGDPVGTAVRPSPGDDGPVWQPFIPRNSGLYVPAGTPLTGPVRTTYEDTIPWAPTGRRDLILLTTPIGTPASNRQTYWYHEPTFWAQRTVERNLVLIVTPAINPCPPSDPAFVAAYRNALQRNGQDVTFIRHVGVAPNIQQITATVRAHVMSYVPDTNVMGRTDFGQRLGSITQGDRKIIVLCADLAAKGFPVPPQKHDKVIVQGETLDVIGPDLNTKLLAGAYELVVAGI